MQCSTLFCPRFSTLFRAARRVQPAAEGAEKHREGPKSAEWRRKAQNIAFCSVRHNESVEHRFGF
eukprot:2309224-Alexandrium_andersonii.AAC.1